MNKLVIFGHGYAAQAFSKRLDTSEWQIVGTTREKSMAATDVFWPGTDLSGAIDVATHILISVPPDSDGDPVLNPLTPEIRKAQKLRWLGYLSTTAVYGDRGGTWVDEDDALRPATKRGQLRVDAERQWQALETEADLPLHIFRLAGIYGPGRGPFEKVQSGAARRIIKAGQVFSRIHVEDLATVLIASIAQPNSGAIYNVCDDLPAPPEDVIGYAAELLGLPVPPAIKFENAELSDMARSFYAESKRVRNERLKRELGVSLAYPDYRVGLSALLAQSKAAGTT